MQSIPRVLALFSILIASSVFVGCGGGPGAPVSGGSDPSAEAAAAALSPEEGGPQEGANPTAEAASPKAGAEAASEPASGEGADAKPE